MANEIRNTVFLSTFFAQKYDDAEEKVGSARLREPRDLYSAASLQHPPKWPIECQVIPEKVKHVDIPPVKLEPFYMTNNTEPQPRPVGEEMGTIIYDYQPKLSVDYFCRSTVGGSEELQCFENTDPNSLKFESRFESGNLARAIKVTNVYYELYLRPDMYTARHAQWYYFRIQNTRENVLYRFSIVNLNKPDSLYRYGLKPLVYSEKESRLNKIGWTRRGQNIAYYKNDIGSDESTGSYTLTFNLKFRHNNDTVYIAQCYPYTYSKLQSYLHEIESDKLKSQLCQQRLLCKSLAGNNVYVLTITSPENDEEENEEKKPVVVLSARVHPGETPSSYMMKGIIDFLISGSSQAQVNGLSCPYLQTFSLNQQAQSESLTSGLRNGVSHRTELRNRFIFKLIPMLNPDGVIVGNSRCCLLGQDLNRQYCTVLREAFPQIYHTKVLLRRLAEENGVFMYCDIHGHSRRNNVFIYGCENRRLPEKRLTEQVFPLMMHKNAADKFSFQNCKFKIQKSKEGTGRIFAWTLGICNSYTLEISLCGSTMASRQHTHFSTADYEGIGRHFCETLLDFSDNDPAKEKIREKILRKLLEGGSTAEEPVNIPITDYSSLSHSETDESDTTEDDEEEEALKAKASIKRQKSVRQKKAIKRVALFRTERSSINLSTTSVEFTRGRKNKQHKCTTTEENMEAIQEKEQSVTNILSSFRKSRLLAIHERQDRYAALLSPKKYTRLLFDDPFNPPSSNLGLGGTEAEENADTGTQTEDECDYSDSAMKNEIYLATSSNPTQELAAGFQSLKISTSIKRTSTNTTTTANVTTQGHSKPKCVSDVDEKRKPANVTTTRRASNPSERRGSLASASTAVTTVISKRKLSKGKESQSQELLVSINKDKSKQALHRSTNLKLQLDVPEARETRRRVSWAGGFNPPSSPGIANQSSSSIISVPTFPNTALALEKSKSNENKQELPKTKAMTASGTKTSQSSSNTKKSKRKNLQATRSQRPRK